MQKLAIVEVLTISEPEPTFVEVQVKLMDGSLATLRMNIFVAQNLTAALSEVAGSA